jgi:murein DD-endopeptidase MepM/ murein hydrolase activator NlpD
LSGTAPRFLRRAGASAIALVALAALPPSAVAAVAGGGIHTAGSPRLADATCASRCVAVRKATPGATVRLTGSHLDSASRVVFQGAEGRLPSTVLRRSAGEVRTRVPKGATSGRPYVVNAEGLASNPSPKQLQVLPVGALPQQVFPVRGAHEYWDGFGAGRHHEGVDVGARCGTPLVAAMSGRVRYTKYQSAAGNYLILDVAGTDLEFGYMHLIRPAPVKPGTYVSAGQVIGNVGETGNASGCHLHFEVWKGVWYGGGSAIDPMPYLKAWDRGRRV